jgi:N-acetylglutamate synthase-like GNAT family acetyltransferase
MIRTAEKEDYQAVKQLVRQGESEGTLQHRSKKEIRKSIKRGRTLVAEQDGEITGTVSVDVHSRRLAEVRSFFVTPTHRGNGTGRQLLEAILEQPVKILPSATIFAITTVPHTFERVGFDQKQAKSAIVFKRI